jgi:hypothetical protein
MAKKIGDLTVKSVNTDMRYIKAILPQLKKAIREGDIETAKDIANEISGIGGNWASDIEQYEIEVKRNG